MIMNKDKNQKFNLILVKIGESNDEFLIVYQLLRSVNCEQYFPLFKFNGIDGKFILQMQYEKLKGCFNGQISDIELSKISNSIEQFKWEIQDYENLKEQCNKMRQEVDKYRNRAIELRNKNKLKKLKIDSEHFKESYFEFSNGSGHTYLLDYEGSEYYGYSNDFKPVSPFYIQYISQDVHEINYAHLTKDYQDYFGYYLVINQNLDNPYQLYAKILGSQKRNDITMKIYRDDKNGQQLGCNIIDENITAYEVPVGQQIYIDLLGRHMIRYFEQGVEISYEDYLKYKNKKKQLNSEQASKLLKEQSLFQVYQYQQNQEEIDNIKQLETEKIPLINKE